MASKGPISWLGCKEKLEVLEIGVKIFAFFFGGLWVLWTFVFQEYTKPAKVPAPLQISLDLKMLGKREGSLVIGATFKVQNTGGRRLHLLPSVFVASTFSIEEGIPDDGEFRQMFSDLMDSKSDIRIASRFGRYTWPQILVVKRLFLNWVMDADEVSETTFLFEVPAEGADFLLGTVLLPTILDTKGVVFEWVLSKDGKDIQSHLECSGITTLFKAKGRECDYLLTSRKYNLFKTEVEIPLKQSEPQPTAATPVL